MDIEQLEQLAAVIVTAGLVAGRKELSDLTASPLILKADSGTRDAPPM